MTRITFIVLGFLSATGQAHVSTKEVLRHAQVVKTITEVATRVGVPVELMLATAWVESSYRTSLPVVLDGSTPSYGVFQIKLETAQWVARVYHHRLPVTAPKLQNLEVNSIFACKYMKLLLKRYDGNVKMAVDAYNKGHVVSTESEYVTKVHRAMKGIK